MRRNVADVERARRMGAVAEKKSALLRDAFPDELKGGLLDAGHCLQLIGSAEWTEEQARTYLVDLVFADPFGHVRGAARVDRDRVPEIRLAAAEIR